MDTVDYFRLSTDRARSILGEVSTATNDWRATARRLGHDDPAIEQMSPAFEHDQARRARQLTD